MKKTLLFAFLFFGWIQGIQAQEAPKESYFGMGIGLQSRTFKDQTVTQSTYQGTNFFLSLQHEKEESKK